MAYVTLVLVLLLPDGHVIHEARAQASIEACELSKQAALEAVERSGDVVDVGVLCIQTKFDDKFKPAA